MSRQPQFGQGAGAQGPISSDVYEQYAPQMAMTDYQTDLGRSGYELSRDVELESQAQLDAQIAQSEAVKGSQKLEAEKLRKKRRKGQRVSSAAAGATLGAQVGSIVPGVGNVVGGIVGGLGGLLFGEEGGYVPNIHPRSMLFKEYQQGGDVTGYTGQGKFLRRGLQNLQFRQEEVNRAAKNAKKAGKYGFWDAALDVGKGYMAGKTLAPQAETMLNLAKSTYGLAKNKGLGAVWDVLSGKLSGLPSVSPYQNIETPVDMTISQQPTFGAESILGLTSGSSFDKSGRITKGLSSTRKTLSAADKRLMNTFVSKSPVRDTALTDTSISKNRYKPKWNLERGGSPKAPKDLGQMIMSQFVQRQES